MRQIRVLRKRGNVLSRSGFGYVGSKKDMELFLELAQEEGDLPKSVIRRLKYQVSSPGKAEVAISGPTKRKWGTRELYQPPGRVDITRDRVEALREKVGQEHYLLKYKALSPTERAKLESKRIEKLAQEGQSWRETERDSKKWKDDIKKEERIRKLQQRAVMQHRPTRLDK